MKTLSRVMVISFLVICMIGSTAFAGNTNYTQYSIHNTGQTVNHIANTDNTKATVNANWFMKVNSIYISELNTYPSLWGLKFLPMKKNTSGVYNLCGAAGQWHKTTTATSQYAGWNGNGTIRTYGLGVRMDDAYSSNCVASSSGYWNSN